jgi:hypothetical protein
LVTTAEFNEKLGKSKAMRVHLPDGVSLAAKTGDSSNHMSAAAGYLHGSQITDSKLQGAYVVAHELGHVEQAETAEGRTLQESMQSTGEQLNQKEAALGPERYSQDPDVPALRAANQGCSLALETGADQRAWDIVGAK